jgi:hypothetical protein
VIRLLTLPARSVDYLPYTDPAVFYDYAFTDDFDPLKSRYGPGAARAIRAELEAALSAN